MLMWMRARNRADAEASGNDDNENRADRWRMLRRKAGDGAPDAAPKPSSKAPGTPKKPDINRLHDLYNDEKTAGRVLTSAAADLMEAKGYKILSSKASDDDNSQDEIMPEEADLLIKQGRRKIAVQCAHRQPNQLVSRSDVHDMLASCVKAGVRRVIIMTDASFDPRCHDIKKTCRSVKLDLWNWKRIQDEQRKHLPEKG